MFKCPNCGSTAQPQHIGSTECEAFTTEYFACDCGAKITRVMKRVEDRVWVNGTLIKRVRYSGKGGSN